MWNSWFHDPIANLLSKPGRDCRPAAMMLQGNHRCFYVERAIGILDSQRVCELQWQVRSKQDLSRGSEFDYGSFGRLTLGDLSCEADRNPHRRGVAKELGEPDDRRLRAGACAANCRFRHREPSLCRIDAVQGEYAG